MYINERQNHHISYWMSFLGFIYDLSTKFETNTSPLYDASACCTFYVFAGNIKIRIQFSSATLNYPQLILFLECHREILSSQPIYSPPAHLQH